MAKCAVVWLQGLPEKRLAVFQISVPTFTFPHRQFGVSVPVNRSFQAAWFNCFKNGYSMMLGKMQSSVLYVARLSRKGKLMYHHSQKRDFQ